MLPLQAAVDSVLRLIRAEQTYLQEWEPEDPADFDYDCTPVNGPPFLFPFLATDLCQYAVQGSLKGGSGGLVFEVTPDSYPTPLWVNLDRFFLALNECWENGIYRVSPFLNSRTETTIYDQFLIDSIEERHVFGKYAVR